MCRTAAEEAGDSYHMRPDPWEASREGHLRRYVSSAEIQVITMTMTTLDLTILHPAETCACTSMTKYPCSLDMLGSSTHEKGLVKVMRFLNLRYFEQRDLKSG